MRVRVLFTTIFLAFALEAPLVSAAEKAWHEGTVLSVERQEKTTTIKRSDSEYSKDHDKVKAKTTSTTSEVPTDVFTVFTITDGQKTYVARQGNTVWHSKTHAQPGDKIQFSVSGDSLYIRENDSKEVKLKVLRASLASSQSENP